MIHRIKIIGRRWAHQFANLVAERVAAKASMFYVADLTKRLAQEGARCRHLEQQQQELKQKQAKLLAYLADIPPTSVETLWAKEDRDALAAFLETNTTGKALMQHLSNRLADYERAAVLYAEPQSALALCKRAHGFRDCRGELLRLSAAGPSPATNEAQEIALPEDLENLRA